MSYEEILDWLYTERAFGCTANVSSYFARSIFGCCSLIVQTSKVG